MALVGDAHIIEAWLGGKRLKIEGQLIYDIVLVSGIRKVIQCCVFLLQILFHCRFLHALC